MVDKEKQVVYFTGHAKLIGAGNGKVQAHIYDVIDHPMLGSQEWVTTSLVQEHNSIAGRDPTYIETLNTIYKQAVKE